MPEYLHPSVRTTIIDRSFVFQSAQGSTVLFAVFMAEKGPDNVIVELNTVDEALFYFGEPNIAEYGQSFYNVLEWLKSGGKAQVIRILPADATYSSLLLQLSTKGLATDATGREITPAIISATSVTAPASLAAVSSLLTGTVVPVAGVSTYPLAAIIPTGRGASYNGMGARITLLDNLDNTYDFRTYNIEFTIKDATGNDVTVDGPYIVSFDRFARSKSRESMYFASVVNKYSQFVRIVDNAANIDKVMAIAAGPRTDIAPNEIDMFFGIEKANDVLGSNPVTDKLTNAKVATTEQILLDGSTTSVDGVAVIEDDIVLVKNQSDAKQNGVYTVPATGAWVRSIEMNNTLLDASKKFITVTSGDTQAGTNWKVSSTVANVPGTDPINWVKFRLPLHSNVFNGVKWNTGFGKTNDPTNPAAINYLDNGKNGVWTPTTEEQLLVQAYSGIVAPAILDKRQYPIDVILDSNCSTAVKNAMSALAGTIRGDCVAILDCGFQANASQTIDYRTNYISMSDRNTAIFAHDFVVFDAYNGENIKVTTPYFIAAKIPSNDDRNGIQYPFVGPLNGALSGFEAINFLPNEAEKENLYKKQINYVERDPKRTNLGSQLTSQTANSALSDLNNVRALLRMVRDVEEMMSDNRFKFNDQITLDDMNYDLNNYLQKWKSNRTCASIAGTVYRSDYDRQQKIARVKIELVFTGIIERIFVDWIVNR